MDSVVIKYSCHQNTVQQPVVISQINSHKINCYNTTADRNANPFYMQGISFFSTGDCCVNWKTRKQQMMKFDKITTFLNKYSQGKKTAISQLNCAEQ